MTEANSYGPRHVSSIGFEAPCKVGTFGYDEGELEPGHFRVATAYTGISAGTELSFFQGSNPYLNSHWDQKMKLFRPGASQHYPIPFMGYMESGQVVASRTPMVREGQYVAMTYGHKTGHTAHEGDYYTVLPEGFDPLLGIYVAQMGPIVANGLLHADDELGPVPSPAVGSSLRDASIVILGTGVIGFLTGIWARWMGAREVVMVGRNPHRLQIAERLGMTPVNNKETDIAWWIKTRWSDDNEGERGADIAFHCSGSPELLDLGFKCLRPQRAVVDLGFYQGEAAGVRLGEEFHHNGLRHICAQIFRVPLRQRSAWHHHRLRLETIRFLQANGDLVREHLINTPTPFSRAQEIYDQLNRPGCPIIQGVLAPDEG